MNAKSRMTVVIIVLLIAAVGVVRYLSTAKKQEPINAISERSKGNPNARIQVVEFVDMQCPACANGTKLLKDLMQQHPEDIYLQVKLFPLVRSHRHAMQSALYAHCAAAQAKFWPFFYQTFERQAEWRELLSAQPIFDQIIASSELNRNQLDACVISEAAAQAIKDDQTLGQSLGVQSTPTYIINNKMVVGSKALDEELKTYFNAN